MNSSWNRLRELPLQIDGYRLAGLELETNSGFKRLTTEITLEGSGAHGRGEEVGWGAVQQEAFRTRGAHLDLAGEHTLGSFSALLDGLELSPDKPPIADWEHYRRWAFESAALDLALGQNGMTLEQALGREGQAVNFVVSLSPSGMGDIEELTAIHAKTRFKLDAAPQWSEQFCGQLAGTEAVEVVDFKGAYSGTPVDVAPDLPLYRRVLDAMPEVIVEDPHDVPEVLELLIKRDARVAWDAPIHKWSDLERMPLVSSALNIKPSRFGTLQRLLEAYEACEEQGLPMYGGGQFELGVGRLQIQRLAGLFHPGGGNDVAPRGYHQLDAGEERPASPLSLDRGPRDVWPSAMK